jgi:hypothetical protein
MLMIPFTGGGNTMNRTRILTASALAAALTVSTAYAQQQQQQGRRLAGTIERVDDDTIYARGRDGSAITLKRANMFNTGLKGLANPGTYIATGAIPYPDGTSDTVEVHIFAQPQSRLASSVLVVLPQVLSPLFYSLPTSPSINITGLTIWKADR